MKRQFLTAFFAAVCLLPVSAQVRATMADGSKYPIVAGANLRILDDNIWDYSKETLPPAWEKIGADCRDNVRAPQFAGLIADYMPDVFGFQEYSSHMHAEFYPLVEKMGYKIAWENPVPWNNTPIFYNPETVELNYVNYNLYTPEQWSNHGSKSFTSAVFTRREGGEQFALLCTHLWWKSDSAQPGSTQARASQVRMMLAEAEILTAKFGDIPVIVMGDMNCYEDSVPLQQFIQEGFIPCYKAATVYGDNHNGHHVCSPGDGFSKESRRRSPEREGGAIDHLLIKAPEGKAEVKVFDCIMEEYTVKLTDHYPNLLDIKL